MITTKVENQGDFAIKKLLILYTLPMFFWGGADLSRSFIQISGFGSHLLRPLSNLDNFKIDPTKQP